MAVEIKTSSCGDCDDDYFSFPEATGLCKPMIQIFVQTYKTYKFDLWPTQTIGTLKGKIEDHAAISADLQTLILNGKPLNCDNATLKECNICNGCILNVIASFAKTSNQISSIRFMVNVSDILQFIPNQTESICSLEYCDATTTMQSILKQLDILYLADLLLFTFHYTNYLKSSFIYSQIYDIPILQIENIIQEDYDKFICKISLHFLASIPPKIQLNSGFIRRMTEYFENHELDDDDDGERFANCSQFEIDIMLQIVYLMDSVKSTDQLMYESSLCLSQFVQYGIPSEINDDVVEKLIIPTMLKVLTYINYDDSILNTLVNIDGEEITISEMMQKIREIMMNGMLQILRRGRRTDRVIVFGKLRDLVNPCMNADCLLFISMFYEKLCVSNDIQMLRDGQMLMDGLHTLLYYEDDHKVLKTALSAYYSLISKTILLNYEYTVNNVYSSTIKRKYANKYNQNRLIFAGFIYESLIQINIEYIPNDISFIMFKYYNCYRGINMDMIQRMIELLPVITGNHALLVARILIPPLKTMLYGDSNNINIDIAIDPRFGGYIQSHGLIKGLFVMINAMTKPILNMNVFQQVKCLKCGKMQKGPICIRKKGNSMCFQCLIDQFEEAVNGAINVIEYLFEEKGHIKDLYIERINAIHGVNILKTMQKIDTSHASIQSLQLRAQKLITNYL